MRVTRWTAAIGLTACALMAAAGTAVAAGGSGSGNGGRTIEIQDDCDPATFNAALGPGACVGDGDVTLDQLLARLDKKGSHNHWAFAPDKTHIDAGQSLTLDNVGGEGHTFTEVSQFGAACVDVLNQASHQVGAPVMDCSTAFAGIILPGQSVQAVALSPGTHLFECAIHPWMRATIEVRDR